MLTDALDNAQRKVEAYFFNIRKQLWEYDQVLNTQRDRIYAERRKALLATDLSDLMLEYSEETMNDILEVRLALWCTYNILHWLGMSLGWGTDKWTCVWTCHLVYLHEVVLALWGRL
jgi:preprotein translocase subunit SecA